MAKQKRKKPDKRRKALQRKQAQRQKRRMATDIGDDGTRTTVMQPDGRGYDVAMIGDFLEHLLLELRVQQVENVKALRAQKESDDFEQAHRVGTEVSESLAEQFTKYHKKYATALLPANTFDTTNATEAEIREAVIAFLTHNIEKRDEQIGHLEALQELFDEALACAKTPFGVDSGGNLIQPQRIYPVREMQDSFLETPDYDELRPDFDGHWLTTDEGMERLKQPEIIVARLDGPRDVIIHGRAAYEAAKNGKGNVGEALVVPIEEPDELQFLVATVAKLKGRHDYLGNYYDEF